MCKKIPASLKVSKSFSLLTVLGPTGTSFYKQSLDYASVLIFKCEVWYSFLWSVCMCAVFIPHQIVVKFKLTLFEQCANICYLDLRMNCRPLFCTTKTAASGLLMQLHV